MIYCQWLYAKHSISNGHQRRNRVLLCTTLIYILFNLIVCIIRRWNVAREHDMERPFDTRFVLQNCRDIWNGSMHRRACLLSGFLPTFGPSFLHFYGSGATERSSCFGKVSTALPFYRGRVLLSMKTEMDDSEAMAGLSVETDLAAPIIEVRPQWLIFFHFYVQRSF